MEILKQHQHSPMKVEHQVAIIYCGVKELLRKVPVDKVKEFENNFLELMEMEHRDVLDSIRDGMFNENIEEVLGRVANEVASRFQNAAVVK